VHISAILALAPALQQAVTTLSIMLVLVQIHDDPGERDLTMTKL
jgi:hypothetical protein